MSSEEQELGQLISWKSLGQEADAIDSDPVALGLLKILALGSKGRNALIGLCNLVSQNLPSDQAQINLPATLASITTYGDFCQRANSYIIPTTRSSSTADALKPCADLPAVTVIAAGTAEEVTRMDEPQLKACVLAKAIRETKLTLDQLLKSINDIQDPSGEFAIFSQNVNALRQNLLGAVDEDYRETPVPPLSGQPEHAHLLMTDLLSTAAPQIIGLLDQAFNIECASYAAGFKNIKNGIASLMAALPKPHSLPAFLANREAFEIEGQYQAQVEPQKTTILAQINETLTALTGTQLPEFSRLAKTYFLKDLQEAVENTTLALPKYNDTPEDVIK